jgi:hypothetical protein
MANLDVNLIQYGTEDKLIVTFNLDRKPTNEDNRLAWDKLLRKHSEDIMPLSVALVMGNEPARAVQSKSFQFYIVKNNMLWTTLAACLVVFFTAFYLLVKNPTALRDSENGYYSLGKSQMAFWGLLVVLTFVGIWFLTGTMERIPDQVLILLGISGATGLSAKVIGENKKSTAKSNREARLAELGEKQKILLEEKVAASDKLPQGKQNLLTEINNEIDELSKTAAIEIPNFWKDICDDGNGMSFHRLQVVIWTVVLGIVFVRTVSQVISMPEFSETLLILLGISNGTYLGFKIPEKTET